MRHLGFGFLTGLPAAVALAVPVAVPAGPVASARAALAGLRVITAFAPGDFPESLADGIAFGIGGDLYMAVKDNRLVRLAPDGGLTQLAATDDGLVYPALPTFGTTPATRTTLYITNGALRNGTPDIVAFDAGVRGLPLP